MARLKWTVAPAGLPPVSRWNDSGPLPRLAREATGRRSFASVLRTWSHRHLHTGTGSPRPYSARGDRLEALWVLAISTGLRRGELLGLTWDDIDLDRRQLRVTKALQRVSGKGLVLVETKTRRARRSIVLPVGAAEALRRQRGRQAEERLAAGSSWKETDFVLKSSDGTALDPDNVGRSFALLLDRAKLPRMRFHDLRHSCASLLLAQHVPPRVVMETLGHSRISVTLDTYTHVMPALQRDAADAMDRALGADREP